MDDYPDIKSGLMFVGSANGHQGLYIVTKNIHKVMLVAYNKPTLSLDQEYHWCSEWHPGIYKEVKREDLPLYLNFYHGEKFLRLMKGERVI
jgi:hypothetical protein